MKKRTSVFARKNAVQSMVVFAQVWVSARSPDIIVEVALKSAPEYHCLIQKLNLLNYHKRG